MLFAAALLLPQHVSAKSKPEAKFVEDETGEEAKTALDQQSDYELNKPAQRSSLKAYSTTEADEYCPDTNPYDVVTRNDDYNPSSGLSAGKNEFPGQKAMLVTKLIVDNSDPETNRKLAISVNNTIRGFYNIREVWISGKVDAVEFIKAIYTQMRGGASMHDRTIYVPQYSMMMHSQRTTLFLPESAAAAVKQLFARPTWSHRTLFSIKTYKGDVYTAQKAGADAAQPFCVNHVFTDKVAGADKIYKYGDCKTPSRYFYSCKVCGLNEHNVNHTFASYKMDVTVHDYQSDLANAQAYVGVNAAGHHVWWKSCIWCGHNYGYDQRHITKGEWKNSGTGASYEYFAKAMKDAVENAEQEALLLTTAYPGMFILPLKSDAKTSKAYESSVNFALNDHLLDDAVLGKDYTLPLKGNQLLSLAVRLAEELMGKEIKVSVAGDDAYRAKASAMGILDEHFSSLESASPATKEQTATLLYKVLRYIESQKIYSYSEYESNLSTYKDQSQISPWATEALAFMEALGLFKPLSKDMLAPKGAITIEQAVDMAERSTLAQQLGWYQARSWGENEGRDYQGTLNGMVGIGGNHFISPGERIWVVAPRIGEALWGYLPTRDSYSGQTVYAKSEWFRPVRPYVFSVDKSSSIIGQMFGKSSGKQSKQVKEAEEKQTQKSKQEKKANRKKQAGKVLQSVFKHLLE